MPKKQDDAPIYYRGVRYDKQAPKGLEGFAAMVDTVYALQAGSLHAAKDAIYAFRDLNTLGFDWEWLPEGLMIECENGETCTVSTVKQLCMFNAGVRAGRAYPESDDV